MEALGVGYFFLMTMDLSPTLQSSIYAPSPGGIGRGLLPQTIIDAGWRRLAGWPAGRLAGNVACT